MPACKVKKSRNFGSSKAMSFYITVHLQGFAISYKKRRSCETEKQKGRKREESEKHIMLFFGFSKTKL